MTEIELRPFGVVATVQELHAFTGQWLANRNLSDHTRRAYERNVRSWVDWCDARGLDPLRVRFTHVNSWARFLEECGSAQRSVAQALSSVSSWYGFMVKMELIEANPVLGVDRPKIDRTETATVGFTAAEAGALVVARPDRWLGDRCAAALILFLVHIGARVTEACGVTLADLGHDSGHRFAELRMKGRKTRRRPIPPSLSHAIDLMLAERAEQAGVPVEQLAGRLFVDAQGRPLTQRRVFRFVQRMARAAGLPGAGRISPHSFRHAFATIASDNLAGLQDIQEALGHKDPRTTQLYLHRQQRLDRDPAYLVATAVAASGTSDE